MGKRGKVALLSVSGLALLLTGAALGFLAVEQTRGLIPTKSFIEERMMECGTSATLYRLTGQSPRARRLIGGDLVGCHLLLEAWSGGIGPEHDARIERIRAAYQHSRAHMEQERGGAGR